MTATTQPSPARLYAALMIGAGLVVIGIVLFMLLNNPAAFPDDLSAVPVQVDFASPKLTLKTYRESLFLWMIIWGVSCLSTFGLHGARHAGRKCQPCKHSMKNINQMVLCWSAINQEEPREVVEPFVKEFGLTFPVWLDLNYQAEQEFKTNSLPSSFVIDRTGRVRLMWFGSISKKILKNM